EHRNMRELRNDFLEKLQSFAIQFSTQRRQPRNVPARSRQANNVSVANRVAILCHDYRNCFCRVLGRTSCFFATRDQNVYFEAHKFLCEGGASFLFALCAPPLNNNVFPLDVTELAQTLAERLVSAGTAGKGGDNQISYPWDFRWLLRLRGRAKRK